MQRSCKPASISATAEDSTDKRQFQLPCIQTGSLFASLRQFHRGQQGFVRDQ